MTQYEMNDEEKKVLMVFLGRVQLQGNEVPAFNALINKFNKPVEEKIIKKK